MSSTPLFKIMDAAGSAFSAVNYNAKKEKNGGGELVHFDNFGPLQDKAYVSKEEFEGYLKDYSSKNKRVKKPSFHAVCSIKGREWSHEELKDLSLEIMRELGYEGNPVLIYSHHDTENNHVHIVSSRIGRDGKKINDSFEHKRANHALNAILNRNEGQEYNKDINNVLRYKFNTVSQFKLLMERLGYKINKEGGDLTFYKYGRLQGRMSYKKIQEKGRRYSASENAADKQKEIKQIQALIYKYKKEHSSILKSNKDFKHTTEDKRFYSDLTEHLKESFGLEFVFFAGEGYERPYGYTLIDHRNKEMYKGGQVFNLNRLTDNSAYGKGLQRGRLRNKETQEATNVSGFPQSEEGNVADDWGKCNDRFEFANGIPSDDTRRKKKKKKKNRRI